jgi:hypothetical protein
MKTLPFGKSKPPLKLVSIPAFPQSSVRFLPDRSSALKDMLRYSNLELTY